MIILVPKPPTSRFNSVYGVTEQIQRHHSVNVLHRLPHSSSFCPVSQSAFIHIFTHPRIRPLDHLHRIDNQVKYSELISELCRIPLLWSEYVNGYHIHNIHLTSIHIRYLHNNANAIVFTILSQSQAIEIWICLNSPLSLKLPHLSKLIFLPFTHTASCVNHPGEKLTHLKLAIALERWLTSRRMTIAIELFL